MNADRQDIVTGAGGGPVAHVQTKREIESILNTAGLKPRKSLGQHFLVDGNLMRRLVQVAELHPNDFVIEVGAGTGGLTDLLIPLVDRMLAIELDRDLFALLRDRFADFPGITILNVDVLERKHRLAPEVVEAIAGFNGPPGAVVKLVANLPYHVATPLLMNLLIDYPQVRRFVFTVQQEVGERIAARPSVKAYGPLSIVAQTLATVETITHLPPHVFWPRPEVDSVMMRIDVGPFPFADRDELHRFVSVVRGVFEHRRKTLRSALGYIVSNEARERVCERWDATRRPEAFSPAEWMEVFRMTDAIRSVPRP